MIALALALALVMQLPATTAPAGPESQRTPVAPGAPQFAQLASIVGVSPDSSTRAEFLASFRGVFASDKLPGERLSAGGEWQPGLPLPNRFRLLEGSEAEDAWKLQVSIGAPAPLRVDRPDLHSKDRKKRVVVPKLSASRGMRVALTVHVPASPGVSDRTLSSSAAFYFPAGVDAGVSLGVPATGYRFPWSAAGRIAATLVIETLNREGGDLTERERMDITPAVRVDAVSAGSR